MEDALGPIGAGIVGLSLYAILKAMWWGGYEEENVHVVHVEPELRRSTRIVKRLRTD
jgi:hypothetical protein